MLPSNAASAVMVCPRLGGLKLLSRLVVLLPASGSVKRERRRLVQWKTSRRNNRNHLSALPVVAGKSSEHVVLTFCLALPWRALRLGYSLMGPSCKHRVDILQRWTLRLVE